MRALLGGKGANIAELSRVLGPELVPAGFKITTEACVALMRDGGQEPIGLAEPVAEESPAWRSARGAGSGTRTRSTAGSQPRRVRRLPGRRRSRRQDG
jgi:phosphoenolpyruvate synthase/pyruvate phosphate dikinase